MVSEEIHDLLAYNGLKIIQRKDLFRFSLDSLLLGDFVFINPKAKRILDLGTGLAPVPLYLSLKTNKPIIGIDIQTEAVALAKKSVSLNRLESQIKIIECDMREFYRDVESNSFDIITVNPPFFKYHHKDFLNELSSQTISRHEVTIDLEGLIQTTKRLLSTGGSLNMIHRANRIDEIVQTLMKHHLILKRLRFVYTKKHKPATMVLIEARMNGNVGHISIEEPLYVYDESHEYTKEVLQIFHLGDEHYDTNSTLSK